MLALSKLLNELDSYGDRLRYHRSVRGQKLGTAENRGPVVAWNITRRCNLNCSHCYAESADRQYSGELTTGEAREVIDDLAEFNVPVILFSGGEPLLRDDLFALIRRARDRGIRVTISTNGTLIDAKMAERIKDAGVSYVGISVDGIRDTHDDFRGQPGAFRRALGGIRNCRERGQKVGIRFTITQDNYQDIDDMFTLVDEESVSRICFYHLVYSGRATDLISRDLPHATKRRVLDTLIERTRERKGAGKEILTVANHADGIYTYLQMRDTQKTKAEVILRLLKANGGNRSGIAIASIGPTGDVHPDQFSTDCVLDNVRERSFSRIWRDDSGLLGELRDRKKLLKGRCGRCIWVHLCNGNLRTRAHAMHGDFWQEDPACYLTDGEIERQSEKVELC